MAKKYKRRAGFSELSEISQTPLIDLSMLLLVTFLITYPLMEHGLHINLPVGQTSDLQPLQHRTITVDIEGNLFLDNSPVGLAELAEAMRSDAGQNPDLTVYVRADQDIRYGRVVDVMKVLHDAKITRMALITRAE